LNDDIWERIVKVQGHTKTLTLRAEEVDPEQEFFFPPVIQQRDGHDHIIRAKTAQLGLKDFEDEDSRDRYIHMNLDKALGHEYRAFFDISDWLAILYREKILSVLEQYSPDYIDAVIPTYYREIVPRVEKLHREIAGIRNQKDIGAGDGILKQVAQYRALLDVLDNDWCQIIDSKSSLDLRRKQEKSRGIKSFLIKLVIGALLAVVGAFAGWFFRGE